MTLMHEGGPAAGPPSAPAAGEVILSMEGIRKSFYGQEVLHGVDLDVRAGELHALVGENGSGKSTLIKALAGFHPMDAGQITMDGETFRRLSTALVTERGIRFVHQSGGLISQLSAVENVMLTERSKLTRLRTVDTRADAETVRELLAVLGVQIDLGVPVAELRAVERTAVSLAKALAGGDMRVLVLDEPTAALPPTEVGMLFTLLRRVVSDGAAVVYVTHRLDEVLQHADRATVLRDGHRVATRAVSELDEPALAALIVGPDRDPLQVPAAAPSTTAPVEGRPFQVKNLRTPLARGLDIVVQPGEVVGIGGLSGSGREEVASALVGIGGSFDLMTTPAGQELTATDPRTAQAAGVVLVPGNRLAGCAVFPFTVQENLGLTCLDRTRGRLLIDRRAEAELVEQWMERLDIRPRDPRKSFRELSGGNQQKVILAKWLATEPSVVVMDEPTSGVDVGARRSIYQLVHAFAGTGTTFLFCSSDTQDLVEMADRVLLMSGGRIVDEVGRSQLTSRHVTERLAQISGHQNASARETSS